MITEKMPALCLSTAEFNENDKILTLFTLQHGKLSAKIRGVKKKDAKLKFAAQPFCFGEYELNGTGSNWSVTGCALVNSFYELTGEIARYYSGSLILDSLRVIPSGKPEPEIFFNALKFLNICANGNINPGVLAAKYLLSYFALNGRGLNFDCCSSCGKKTSLEFYSFDSGAMCTSCGGDYKIDSSVLKNLKEIDALNAENLSETEYKSKSLSVLAKTAIEQYGFSADLLSMINLYS